MPAASPKAPHELTLVEEIALLAIDDKTGKRLALPANTLGFALAGAVILDLSLAGSIDTDPRQLTVINPAPTGSPLLDVWLSRFHASRQPKSVLFWLHELAAHQEEIHRAALERLVERGILRRQEHQLFGPFKVRRYQTLDDTERTEVRARLTQLILSEELPTPRDVMLLSLIHGCRLSEHFFAGLDLQSRKRRLETLAGLDLVGRDVSRATLNSLDVVGRALSETPVSF